MPLSMVDLEDIKPKIFANYEERIKKCINDTRRSCATDFFIIVQHKPIRRGSERGLITNIKACFAMPTPFFDGTLYKYGYNAETLDLIWTLPAEEYALNLYHNRSRADIADFPLLDFVLKYFDGTLFKIVDEWEQTYDGRAAAIERSKSSIESNRSKSNGKHDDKRDN